MPELAATASASSTTSSRVSTRSPCVSIPTLHLTGCSPRRLAGAASTFRFTRLPLLIMTVAEPLAQFRQQRRELFQAAQVVAGQHQVDVLGGDHHPESARPELRVVAPVRVHPYQAVAQPGKPFHCRGEDGRVAPVEA